MRWRKTIGKTLNDFEGLPLAKYKLLKENEKDTYAPAKNGLIGRFRHEEARIDAKRQFRSRILRMGEDLEAFVYDLKLLHFRAWPQQGEEAENE